MLTPVTLLPKPPKILSPKCEILKPERTLLFPPVRLHCLREGLCLRRCVAEGCDELAKHRAKPPIQDVGPKP